MIVKEQIKKTDGSIKYRNYVKKERLGSGGFAECFLVERMEDKKHYALKIVPKKLLAKSKARQKMLSEIKLHRGAKHRNICDLERAFEDEQHVYMLLQLCKNRNMFELMKRRKKLTVPETQYFIYQMIDALCYLHKQQIIHRDVKLGNLLINQNMQLKLADFGLATKIEFQGDRKHTVCGTPNYIAPEVIRSSMGLGHSGHSYEVDVWSTGVIMYIMLIGRAPFQTTKVEKTYEKISKGQFSFPEGFKEDSAKDLLKNILVVDTSKRYTFQEILAHPFMNPPNGIPKELPQISMVTTPKFGIFQKYAQQEVKQSAREASIQTLRSSIDVTLDEDFGPNSNDVSQVSNSSRNGMDGGRSKQKEVRGLLRSVLSTSSLHKSLKKLSDLGRTTSPQVRNFKNVEASSMIASTSGSRTHNKLAISSFTSRLNTTEQVSQVVSKNDLNQLSIHSTGHDYSNPGRHLHTERHSNIHVPMNTVQANNLINPSPNNSNINIPNNINMPSTGIRVHFNNNNERGKGPTFILNYRKEVIWSYLLNNGNIGTYETNSHYKLLYNRTDKIYFQIVNDGAVKKISPQNATLNQNINNRARFLEVFMNSKIECEAYDPHCKVMYLRRVFQVRPENLILFKFSNDDIQAFNYQTSVSLIVTGDELYLIQIQDGKEVSRLCQKKEKYTECKSKLMISMYLKVKKILYKIHNSGKG